MKRVAILVVAVISFAACNQKTTSTEQTDAVSTTTEIPADAATADAVVYTCPMHPEVTGNKGDKCPKCEMDLVMQEGHEHTDGMHDDEMNEEAPAK